MGAMPAMPWGKREGGWRKESCKCWAYANGTCTTDDDCMGDMICGVPPAIIPKGEEYYDQLPPTPSHAPPHAAVLHNHE